MSALQGNKAIGMLNAARKGKYGIVGACCVSTFNRLFQDFGITAIQAEMLLV